MWEYPHWRRRAGAPHHLVIDLCEETEITGLRYLPRQNLDHGRIRQYNLYLSKEEFEGI